MERGLYADLPVTDAAAARTIAVPMYPGLRDEEQATVIREIRAAVTRHTTAGRIPRPAEVAGR